MKKYIIVIILIYLSLLSALFIYFRPFKLPFADLGKNIIQGEQNTDDKKIIKFISPQIDNPVWLDAKAGFDKAAKEYGFTGIWAGADDHTAEKMIDELKIAIDEGVDGIITCPFNPGSFEEVLQKAKDNSIPVITLAVDASRLNQRAAYIGTDVVKCGRLKAEALHKKTGDIMKIGVIMSNNDAQNQIIMLDELKKYIENIKGAEIVDIVEDSGDPVQAMEVFGKLLDRHPEINCIFGNEGGGVPGLAKIIENRNLRDKLVVIGMDATAPNLEVIEKGLIDGVMYQDFYQMGYLGGKYAYLKATGNEVPDNTYTGTELITRENIDGFIR